MERIEVMTPAWNNLMSFTVDTSGVDFVTLVAGAGVPYAYNRNGGYIFQQGDSFQLLSCGIILPESFTFWRDNALNTPLPLLDLIPWGAISAQAYSNPNWAGGGQWIPMENYELVTDAFFDCKDAINSVDPTKTLLYEDFILQLYFSVALKISMLGVPMALNGKTFKVSPFIKVLHTLPFIAP